MTATLRSMICRKCQWGYCDWQRGPDASIDNVCPECRADPRGIAARRNAKLEQVRRRVGLPREEFYAFYADLIALIVAQEAL